MTTSQAAYLEITLNVAAANRPAAAAVYEKYRQPFLTSVKGAQCKQLLVRDQDVQVIHTFDTVAAANAYLKTDLFSRDIVKELSPLLQHAPEIRIYAAA